MSETGRYRIPTSVGASESLSDAGRIEFDDRGNAIWKPRPELTADEAVRRLMDHPSLTIAPDATAGQAKIEVNPQGLRAGYDPLNSGTLEKRQWRKKKDLRKLSEWIVKNRPDDAQS
jgi:hypothetical protein